MARLLRAAALAALAVLAVGVAVGPAAAAPIQEDGAENETEPPEVEEWVDGEVAIESWGYRDEADEFVIEFLHEGDRPRTVTLVESVQRSEGVGQMAIQQERLIPGRSTVTVQVQRRSGEAALAISTPASIEVGRAVFVSTGMLDRNPFSVFTGTSGLFVGVSVTAFMALLAAWLKLRKESTGVVVAS